MTRLLSAILAAAIVQGGQAAQMRGDVTASDIFNQEHVSTSDSDAEIVVPEAEIMMSEGGVAFL